MRRAVAVFLAAALLLGGCGGLDDDASGDREDIQRFEGLNTPIEVDEGSVFEVALEANASTGYSWQLEEKPPADVLAFEGSSYEADAEGEDAPVGGGGTQTLRFRAVGAGATELSLEYLPPGDGPAAGHESGDVTVR